MIYSVEIELDELGYELTVTYFDPGYTPKGWDPGASAEIELDDSVKVWGLVPVEVAPGSFNAVPGVVERIKFDEFIARYCESNSYAKEVARAEVEQICIEHVIRQMEDDYDDRNV